MEQVLDVYCETYDERHPLICMDEAAKQVTADVESALPMTPGRVRREDHHYERKGVQALLAFFAPLQGWRRVSSRDQRTRRDWAEEVRELLEVDYPQAKLVTLVCDNLNTHDIASLYATFDAVTAHRLARRLRIVHTPRNGSWLNMAEIELSVLTSMPEPPLPHHHRHANRHRRLATHSQPSPLRRPLAFHHHPGENPTPIPLSPTRGFRIERLLRCCRPPEFDFRC